MANIVGLKGGVTAQVSGRDEVTITGIDDGIDNLRPVAFRLTLRKEHLETIMKLLDKNE